MFGQPLDPLDLLRNHLNVMSDDWRNDEIRYSKAILSINEHLSSLNKCITDFINIQDLNDFGYPSVVDVGSDANDNNNNLDNSNISFTEEDVNRLNTEQRIVFNAVTTAVLEPRPSNKLFFLDGRGGTGMTFVYNIVLGYLRGHGVKCIAMATSGIVVGLLHEGRAAHSSLAIPLQLHNKSIA